MALALDLSGRVVLVTGGTRGIGLGITEAFRAAGARVLTCSRSDVDVPDHYVCDVRDPEAVQALVTQVVADAGRLDVLVNNAGGAPYALAADASARFHDKIVGLNLLAPLLCAQAANAVMQQQESGGAIVNVSSVSATRPSPGTAAYGAAKAGLDSLTSSLAVEWGPNVRVNSIDVGLCRTEDTADHYGGDAQVAAIERTIPLGRMARPEEVGHVAVFLASDLASYVSGARVECHGGGEPPVFLAALEGTS
jgi:NAD(P)-dependent dehydrogenase (short-subunit alcohol dehydrogenase family)